ncbi:MAG: MoxR family ATPase [Akkermansiaceae bacterium]
MIQTVRRVYLPEVAANYIARLDDATHPGQSESSKAVKFGASPRAALSMASAAKARAVMNGRGNASFEDVKFVALPVLRHRIVLDYSARVDGSTTDSVIQSLLAEVPFQTTGTPRTLTPASQE